MREVDTAARIGGDEFAVLLRRRTAAAAVQIADRVEDAIDAHAREAGSPAGISLGVGSDSDGTRLGANLMRRAERAHVRRQARTRAGATPPEPPGLLLLGSSACARRLGATRGGSFGIFG